MNGIREIGLTSLHDFYIYLYICLSLFGFSTILASIVRVEASTIHGFNCLTRVYEGHSMLCYKEEF